MNLKNFLKELSVKTCIYFSIIIAIYSFIALIINSNDGIVLLNAGNILLYFVFSILLALANKIFSLKTLHTALRLTIHLIICEIAFYSCILLPLSLGSSQTFVGITFFTVIYFIVAGVVAMFNAQLKKNFEKSENYTSQYKK